MTKKRYFVGTGILLACTMLAVGILATIPRAGVTAANYEIIKVGMSKPEVISILGSEPHHLPGKGPVSGLGGTMGSMMMLERSYSWESSECRIYLAFDDDSKVSGKMLVNVYSESLLDKFRTWLCLR